MIRSGNAGNGRGVTLPDSVRRRIAILASLAILLTAVGAITVALADPSALWRIVHDRCVPNFVQHGSPKPCLTVDLHHGEEHGTVLLKDLRGATQLLLLPTARIGGIESPAILAPGATNYFAAAWRDRAHLTALAGHRPPRGEISLAINSASGRSQNQLHIHIDCLRADVQAALRAHGGQVGDTWAPFPVTLNGHPYWARRLAGPDLTANPLMLLADGLPGAKAHMGTETLVVAGATLPDGQPGFYLLADHVGAVPGDRASGEELQDHGRSCQ